MVLSGIPISENECIGDSLDTINNAFQTLSSELADGGMPTGTSPDRVFYLNDQNVTASYTIPSTKNAMTAGPITINSGVSVTVPAGSVWTVV